MYSQTECPIEFQGAIRGFRQLGKVSYGNDDITDRIVFGYYTNNGRTIVSGEIMLEWVFSIGPQLVAFDDAWRSLSLMKDLLDEMANVNNQNITPDAFRELMLKTGFVDLTEKEKQ